jgi:uncharacterized C2H2 Zn-finger protein
MQDPISYLAVWRKPLIENQYLFLSDQALSANGPDFEIRTSYFPVPSIGLPVQPIPIPVLQIMLREEEPLLILCNCLYAGEIYTQRNQTENKQTKKIEKSHIWKSIEAQEKTKKIKVQNKKIKSS